MSKRFAPTIDGYWTFAKVKKQLGIGEYRMVKLLACGLVRTKVTKGFAPLFNVADIKKCIDDIEADDTDSTLGQPHLVGSAR
jgi:hypothetical protein